MPTFPVVLFAFNRPDHVRRTLAALSANPPAAETDLFIFCDGPVTDQDSAAVEDVRRICRGVKGFQSLHLTEREHNLGLATSIREGVTEVLQMTEGVIVLEDDLLAHPSFLWFMNEALTRYQSDSRLLSVSGYLPPAWRLRKRPSSIPDVWLSRRNLSFGWGTWRAAWNSVQWDQAEHDDFADDEAAWEAFAEVGGEDLPWMLHQELKGALNSWSIRFSYAHMRSNRFAVLPGASYLKPIGFDGSGRHCFPNPLRWIEHTRNANAHIDWPERLSVDESMNQALKDSFSRHHRWAKRLRVISEVNA